MRTTILSASWPERLGLAVAAGFVVLCPVLFDRSLVDSVEFPKMCLLALTALVLAVLGLSRFVWKCTRLPVPTALPWQRPAGLLDLGVLLYLLAAVVATLTSINPRLSFWGTPESYGGLITVAGLVGWYFGLRWLVRGEQEAHILIYGVVAAAALVGVYALLQVCRYDPLSWLMWSGYRSLVRTFSTLGHPNHLSAFAVMVLPLLGYMFLHAWRQRIWIAVAVLPLVGLLLLVALVTCLSRGSWLALGAVLLLLTPVAWKRWGTRRLALTLTATALVVTLLGWFTVQQPAFSPYQHAVEARMGQIVEPGGRRWLWQASWQIFCAQPLTGCGLDTYALGYGPYRSVELTSLEWERTPNHAHNEILHTLATQGLLGGLALVVLGVGLGRCVWLAMRRGDVSQRGFTWVLCAGLLAYLVQIQFNLNVVPCASLFLLLAALLARRAEQTTETSAVAASAPRLHWLRGGLLVGLLCGVGMMAYAFLNDGAAIEANRTPATLAVVATGAAMLGAVWLLLRRMSGVPAPLVNTRPLNGWLWRAGAQLALVLGGLWLAQTTLLAPYEASQLSLEAESYAKNDPKKSEQLFQQAIALTPSQPLHHVRLGLEASKLGLTLTDVEQREICFDVAQRAFGNALTLVPEDPFVRCHRAHALALWAVADPTHTEAALAEYDAALAREPHCAAILHDACKAALSLRRYDRTRLYATRLHADYPEFGPALAILALTDWVEGKQVEALTKAFAAERLNWRNDWPAYWDFNDLVATLLLTAGRQEEARHWALRGMQVRPNRVGPHLVIGQVAEREGNRAVALQAYQTVLQLQPQHNEATRALQRLQAIPTAQGQPR